MKKRLLVLLLFCSGLYCLKLLWLRLAGSRRVRILCYHRVADLDEDGFCCDEGLVDASPSDFDRQMRFIARHFSVTNFENLAEQKKRGRFEKNALIITFDDGYRDNFENAYPVLQRYGLTATVFLSTAFVGETNAFWWDEIAYCLRKTNLKRMELEIDGDPVSFDLSGDSDKRAAIYRINKIVTGLMKNKRAAEARELLRRIKATLDVEMPASFAGEQVLSWDEVREMSAGGVEFGSHTARHPILTALSVDEIRDEFTESADKIATEVSKRPVSLAYPAGAYNRDCLPALSDAGYEFACTYKEVDSNSVDSLFSTPYELKRIHVNSGDSFRRFKVNVCFPSLMGMKLRG